MFASTNLVVELGIVLVVLIGWQFAVSEFVGGIIMIVLFTLVGSLWLRGRRRRGPGAASQAAQPVADDHGTARPRTRHCSINPGRSSVRSKAGWADSATYTMADLTMLRKELVIGYWWPASWPSLVPVHVWNTLFLHGHGFWTTWRTSSSDPSSPSSVSSARSATSRWLRLYGGAASPSAA